MTAQSFGRPISSLDWPALGAELDTYGAAVIAGLVSPDECQSLIDAYGTDFLFRKRVVMEKHGYGRGEYQYFTYPLPELVQELRTALYPHLAEIANRWNAAFKNDIRYPADLAEFLARCHEAGQTKATPLLLRYRDGDFNCLHQDLYGEHVFPLQVAILLSSPGRDFTGGEFVLTEQRPRQQSRAEVAPLQQGGAVIFPVRERPIPSQRGHRRVLMRHGVSRLRSGKRYTLGIIFHDAK